MKRITLIMFAALLLCTAKVEAKPTTTFRATAESHLVELVNAQRVKHNLKPLVIDPKLTAAARAHSADMLVRDYFEHNSPGQTWDARVRHYTGKRSLIAENIAYGTGSYSTAPSFLREWMNSPPHRANILQPGLRRIGIGIATGSATLATADFSS